VRGYFFKITFCKQKCLVQAQEKSIKQNNFPYTFFPFVRTRNMFCVFDFVFELYTAIKTGGRGGGISSPVQTSRGTPKIGLI
jgi:hypothetical protein